MQEVPAPTPQHVPFTVKISDLTLSSSVRTQVDVFLMVAGDIAIDRVFVLFDVTSVLRGVMQLSLVVDNGAGNVAQITRPVAFTGSSTEPRDLPLQMERLPYSRPIYLRVDSTPDGGATPWWTVASKIHGTIHLMDPR
jgi:hypothetical protein